MREWFFQESCCYTKAELIDAFAPGINADSADRMFDRLRVRKIYCCGNERLDDEPDDFEMVDESKYAMRFVGVAVCGDNVIYSIPKYECSLDENISDEQKVKIKSRLVDVVASISKCGELDSSELLEEDISDGAYSFLPLAFKLISDYFENGIYENEKAVTGLNLNGEICWGKTVDEVSPVIIGGRPYYFDLFACRRRINEDDYITRLHKSILCEVSDLISEKGIAGFFERLGYPFPDVVSDEQLLAEEAQDYNEMRITQEMNVQFNTRKQNQLKLMRTYVRRRTVLRHAPMSYLGTTSYHTVWEKACKHVFGDQMEMTIASLGLNSEGNIRDVELGKYIEKPKWTIDTNSVSDDNEKTKNTLRPDCLRIVKGEYFDIIDAKYYLIRYEDRCLRGNPGVGDVTKQLLYELEYRTLLSENSIAEDKIFNVFLVPSILSDNSKEEKWVGIKVECARKFGSVTMERLQKSIQPELNSVEIWTIDAHWLLFQFNNGRTIGKTTSIKDWLLSHCLGAANNGLLCDKGGAHVIQRQIR